jgi:uncharacterized protein YggE
MTSISRALPALLIATLAVAPLAAQAPADGPSRGFIEVNGIGMVQVTPDQARIDFAVETRAGTAAEATAENASRMDAVIRALRSLGVQDLTVETFGYALRPEYGPRTPDPAWRPEIAGYTAQNNIRVTLGDIQAVGRVMDTAVRSGANRVAGLTFQATDTEVARREALTMAVAQARSQAEAMSAALGRTLGEPLEVRGGADSPSPRMPQGAALMAMERAVDTPVEAGDLNVTASVFIRFALGGPAPLEGR